MREALSSLFALVALMLGGAMPAWANAGTAASGSTTDAFSFYPTASAAAVYVDNMIAAGKVDGETNGNNETVGGVGCNSIGQAAGAAGFIDLSVVDATVANWKSYLPSSTSRNTVSYSYDAYAGTANGNNISQNLIEYGRFGYILSQLGLDSTGDANVQNGVRGMLGWLMYGAWYLANGADNIMQWSLRMLSFLNPFRLLYGWFMHASGVSLTANPSENTITDMMDEARRNTKIENVAGDGMVGENAMGEDFTSTAGDKIAGFIGEVYMFCYQNAWLVVIPLMIMVGLVIFLINRGRNRGSSVANSMFKRALSVFLLVAFGIPAWGLAYTAVLENMAQQGIIMSESNEYVSPANRAVIGTLVDTAAWAQNGFDTTGLGIKVTGDGAKMSYSGATVNNLRNITAEINRKSMKELSGIGSVSDLSAQNNVLTLKGAGDGNLPEGADEAYEAAAKSLLDAYVSGDFYQAAQYESAEKGRVQKSKSFAEWLQATSNPETYVEGLAKLRGSETEEDLKVIDHGLLLGMPPVRASIVENNAHLVELWEKLAVIDKDSDDAEVEKIKEEILKILRDEREVDDSMRPGSDENDLDIDWFSPANPLDNKNGELTGRLSVIGTYNYLNTKFDPKGFTVYSAPLSANAQSRVSHYSVSAIGGPVMSWFFAANAIALMLAFGITGLVYGLSLLFSNIKRSATLILSMPVAMFGAMRSLARVVVVAIMMIIELIATILVYSIMQSVLYFVNDFLTSGLTGFITSTFHIEATNSMFVPVMLLVSTLALLFYIVMAIKFRGLITGGVSEAITNLVSRLLVPDPPRDRVADTPSHALGAAAGGVAAGASALGGKAGLAAIAGGAGLGALSGMHAAESLSGDTINDIHANQSSVNNDSSANTMSQGDMTMNNAMDKTLGGASMFETGGSVEGAERGIGLSAINGSLSGAMTGMAGDGTSTEMTRMTADDLGSANTIGDNDMSANADVNGDAYASTVNADDAYASNAYADTATSDYASTASMSADGTTANTAYAEGMSADMANVSEMNASDTDTSGMSSADANASATGASAAMYATGATGDTRGVDGMGQASGPMYMAGVSGDMYANASPAAMAALYGDGMDSSVMAVEKDAMATSQSGDAMGADAMGADGAYAATYASMYGDTRGVDGMMDATSTSMSGDAYGQAADAYAMGADADSSAMVNGEVNGSINEADMRSVQGMDGQPIVSVMDGSDIVSGSDSVMPQMGDVDAEANVDAIQGIDGMSTEATMLSGDTFDESTSDSYSGTAMDARDMDAYSASTAYGAYGSQYGSQYASQASGMPQTMGAPMGAPGYGQGQAGTYGADGGRMDRGAQGMAGSSVFLSGDSIVGRSGLMSAPESMGAAGQFGVEHDRNGRGSFVDMPVADGVAPAPFSVDAADMMDDPAARARARMENARKA